MLPLGFSFFLLVSWTLVGAAVLFGTRAQAGLLRSWLLAPAVGLAVQTVLICIANQAGWGTDRFAWPLEVVSVLVAGVVLYLRRARLPIRALLPFWGAAGVFLLWCGWPALRLGFNWISYVNDDFANYCLSAERFRRAGFFRMPTLPELAGKDYSQYFFFMHVSGLMRFGSEHALAFAASLARLNALKIFMPVILALGGTQICATAALVLHLGKWRRHARWTALLLAVSPLFVFGALYQLIAQVGGLALMNAAVALLTSRFPSGRPRWLILRRSIPTALLATALMLFYPEITPFAFLTVMGCFGLELVLTRRLPGTRVVLLNFTLLGVFVLLRYNLVGYMYTLAHQSDAGLSSSDLTLTLFPFYLIPAGFAVLFGFQTLNDTIADPYSSIIIATGLVLFVAMGIWALRSLRRLVPIGCMLAIFTLMAVYLFRSGNDFGLYKLAMFMQPALWAGVAAVLLGIGRRWLRIILVAAIVALGLPTTLTYTAASTGVRHSSMTELDHASEYLSHLPPAAPGPHDSWVSNMDNIVMLKLTSNLYRDTDLHFLSKDFFNVSSFSIQGDWPMVGFFPDPGEFDRAVELRRTRNARAFTVDTLWDSEFRVMQLDHPVTGYALPAPELSLFNKLNPAVHPTRDLFEVLPAAQANNLLSFVHSSRGNHYYLADRRMISFTQLERDPYTVSGSISSVGRFFLFRVEHPSPEIYLRIAASKTGMGPAQKLWSPGAIAQGQANVPLNFHGGGAANKIVGPLRPIIRDGVAYIALDLAEAPAPFPIHRTGLAALYHRWIPIDYRLVVGFVRDISALTPEQYAALPVPRSISAFPHDIAEASGLQFSGIYEDGWLSPNAEVRLGAAQPGESVRFQGMIPTEAAAGGAQTMTVTVNGEPAWTFPAQAGAFDWSLPIARPGNTTRFEVRFSSRFRLGSPDDRPVGAKLIRVEVGGNPLTATGALRWDASASRSLPSRGIDPDGWTAASGELALPVLPGRSVLSLVVNYPGWVGLPPRATIKLAVDGQAAYPVELKAGDNIVKIPLKSYQFGVRIHIVGNQPFKISPSDGRHRIFRLVSLREEPAPNLPIK
jgi:hypothetical protein